MAQHECRFVSISIVSFIVFAYFGVSANAQQIGRPLTIPAKTIVCPNGNVQFTPCLPHQRQPHQRRSGASSINKSHSLAVVQNSKPAAKVVKANFRTISNSQGIWEGFVTGRGLLSLTLSIYSEGQLQETRYIGQVSQSHNEKPTKFTFKSAIPNIDDWTWDVAVKKIS